MKMDFKNRLKNLWSRENEIFLAPNVDPEEATMGASGFIQHKDMSEFADDPAPDQEVIDGVEEIYFSDISEFDSSKYELDKLPSVLANDELDKYRNVLRRQQQAVSRELSKKILENQGSYVRELTRVMDLEKNLRTTTGICKQGRTNLSQTMNEMACGGLQVLAKNRRKVLLQGILKSLRFIKTLQETDVRLKELLEEGNFSNAIQICLEYRKAAVNFNQYTCISELSNNLLEILEQVKEQLDVALSNLCFIFNQDEYSQIQKAYKLLGNTQIALDAMLMHFVNTVNKVAIQTIYEVLESIGIRTTDTNFSSLCKAVPLEKFTPCLIKLCKNFWTIMYSYLEMVKWHKNIEKSKEKKNDEVEVAFAYDHEMIQSKLEQGLGRIWQDIQLKIESYVLSSNFAFFKYDGLIIVLDIVNQLISIGEEFCNKKSRVLQDSIRTQTINYFKAYHKSNMDELKMFLENEAWELCPVRENFSFLDLKEFYFMKGQISLKAGGSHNVSSSGTGKGYFDNQNYNIETSPFDFMGGGKEGIDKNYHEEVFQYDDEDDDDEDIPDELKLDYIDEKTGEDQPDRPSKPRRQKSALVAENTPVVTNTSLNVLRSFGKYMQMITVLKPIAFDVVTYLTQLFDYYLYSVFTFFAFISSATNLDSDMDIKLKNCLSRIYNSIIIREGIQSEESSRIVAPTLSMMVNLQDPQTLYGFTHKLIGVESLVFLSKQLKMVYHNLDSWIPFNKQAFLSQFYGQTVDIVKEIRTPVFKTISEHVIDYDRILSVMLSVKWDVKELMSDCNPYINILVQEYQKLHVVVHSFASVVPLPSGSLLDFWRNVVIKTSRVFVDGFSSAKKCSNEGRALMLLDFQNFAMKIEDITKLKPIPNREYVVNYINAFYLSEAALEQWLKEHQEYSPKQLSNLITCGTGSHIGKKMKEKFLGLLNEIESNNLMNK